MKIIEIKTFHQKNNVIYSLLRIHTPKLFRAVSILLVVADWRIDGMVTEKSIHNWKAPAKTTLEQNHLGMCKNNTGVTANSKITVTVVYLLFVLR